jgi:hypothetical protein
MSSPISDKWRAALCCFWGLCTPLMSPAADLFYMDHDAFTGKYTGPVGALVMTGDIEPGDYDRLLARIGEDPQRFMSRDKLILASSAGDSDEAMKIGRLLRALHTEVSVGPLTGRCADVCFLIYVAADQRAADGPGLIGIRAAPPADAAAVRDFLRENEVPAYLVEHVVRNTSGNVYWLNDIDEAHLNSRSPAFSRYLLAHCHWDEEMEREVGSGKRPFADMKDMWACRSRVTHSDAAAALTTALKGRSSPP